MLKLFNFFKGWFSKNEKVFEGVSIREVWDFRLSVANPVIDRRGGTWVVQIWSNTNPNHDPVNPTKPLQVYDTGIEATPGDEYDTDKLKVCYQWLYSVRDKYAREDIKERKSLVVRINRDNEALAKMGAAK